MHYFRDAPLFHSNSPLEMLMKLLQVVGKYSVRFPHVSFTCKRAGENSADVRTAVRSTSLDNIRNVYGGAIAREVLEVSIRSSLENVCVCLLNTRFGGRLGWNACLALAWRLTRHMQDFAY